MKKLTFLLITVINIQITISGNISCRSFTISSFLQDPVRTPKDPKQSDPVNTPDGSTGKYRDNHKTHKDNFQKKHLHLKTGSNTEHAREKKRESGTLQN